MTHHRSVGAQGVHSRKFNADMTHLLAAVCTGFTRWLQNCVDLMMWHFHINLGKDYATVYMHSHWQILDKQLFCVQSECENVTELEYVSKMRFSYKTECLNQQDILDISPTAVILKLKPSFPLSSPLLPVGEWWIFLLLIRELIGNKTV